MNRSDKILRINNKAFEDKRVVAQYAHLAKSGIGSGECILLKHYFRKKGNVLDINCKVGRASFPLAKSGHKVFAIDSSKRMIAKAKSFQKNENISFHVKNIIYDDFEKDKFDYVYFSYCGISYIPQKHVLSVLRKIYFSLLPGGKLLISCLLFDSGYLRSDRGFHFFFPSVQNMWKYHKIFPLSFREKLIMSDKISTYPRGLYTHRYTVREMLKLLHKSGFIVEYFNRMYYYVEPKVYSDKVFYFLCSKSEQA